LDFGWKRDTKVMLDDVVRQQVIIVAANRDLITLDKLFHLRIDINEYLNPTIAFENSVLSVVRREIDT
jgi:hypothetical protein